MNSKKGVTPVVAEVVLMGIAVSAAISAGTFLQGALDNVENSAEDQIDKEERVESTSIGIDYGTKGVNGFLIVDVRNTGSYPLSVEEDNQKNWNMYLNDVPADWKFNSSRLQGETEFTLNPQSTVAINTTSNFPSSGDLTEVEIIGPYNVRATYPCYSDGSECSS